MGCVQCQGVEELFNEKLAARELRRFRRHGPGKTSLLLVRSIAAEAISGLTVLDIGAGLGAVHFGLLEAGAARAVDVDASAGYLKAARQEAERRGMTGRVRHLHGDFVHLAGEVEPADIVTMDRVLCCYDDARSLLEASTAKARRFFGLVYPVDSRLLKAAGRLANAALRLLGSRYRVFLHSSAQVEAIARSQGFRRSAYHRRGIWQVVVYGRSQPAA